MSLLKKLFSFLLIFVSILTINSQNTTTYYGSPSTGGGATLTIQEDNTYEISLKQGKYSSIKQDGEEFIFLYDIGYENGGFKVTEDYYGTLKDNLTIHFYRRNFTSDYENIYLGYKSTGEYTFLNLSYETLLFNTENIEPHEFDGSFTITIPRAEYIQLVYKEVDGDYKMDEFKLSKNTNNVYVDYRSIYDKENIFNNSKLIVAEINKRGEIDINERAFATKFVPSNYVERIGSDTFSDWDVPLAVKKEAYKKFNNPKYVYQPVTTITPSSRGEHVKEFQSLKEAVSTLKKDDTKDILLVFNSLLRNNDVHDFNFIFDRTHRNSKLSYLSQYHLDKYLLYYLKPEDLIELKKYKSEESISEVIALNKDLDIVYKENINTNDFYRKYNSMTEELSHNILATNALLKFEKRLNDGYIDATDFLELGRWRRNNIIFSSIEKVEESQSEVVFETTESGEVLSRTKEPRFKTTITYNYPKINYKDVDLRLASLVVQHKNDQSINIPYAKLAFDFISYYSFFNDITGNQRSHASKKTYYEFCLYLSRFPIETSKIQNEFTATIDNHYTDIKEIINRAIVSKDGYFDLITETYDNLIKSKEHRYHTIFTYYIHLFNEDLLSFEKFDTLFKEIAPLTENYTDQIKSFYQDCNCPYRDDLYYYLNTLGNSMAWKAATTENSNKSLLKKALEWSKMTVDISPKNHYYLDTQATIEYFLGNKTKAIELEKKAIQIATDNNDDDLEDYKKTLEKMISGTLKY